jgi:probable HAF family extracellular repeat protein
MSSAIGINDKNQVVGSYKNSDTGSRKAFLWNLITDEVLDLRHLGGNTTTALNINNAGQIVGSSETGDSEFHAFIYEDGKIYDLNDLISDEHGWDYLATAKDVNALGQIIGDINGELHSFILTPVPIPAPVFLLGAGLIGLMAIRRRGQNI